MKIELDNNCNKNKNYGRYIIFKNNIFNELISFSLLIFYLIFAILKWSGS